MRKSLLLPILIVLGCTLSQGTTFYVGNDGSDSNDGKSLSLPMQTLCTALDSIQSPGDTLFIMGGEWFDTCGYQSGEPTTFYLSGLSGTENNPIVILGYPDSTRPIIMGQFIDHDYGHRAGVITNCSWIKLYYLKFYRGYHQGLRLTEVENIEVRNVNVEYCGDNHEVEGSGDNNTAGISTWDNSSRQYKVTIVGCELSYMYMYPIDDSSGDVNTHGLEFYKCIECRIDSNHIHHIGGKSGGQGVGLRFKWNDSLCVAGYNEMHDVSDGPLAGVGCDSIVFHHNVMYNMWWDVCQIKANEFGNNTRSYYYNNTIYDFGNAGLVITPYYYTIDHAYVFNNIFMNSSHSGGDYNLTRYHTTEVTNLTLDHNCYYNSSTTTVVTWLATNYNLSGFQSAIGYDLNSVSVDPAFLSTDSSSANFLHLDPDNSPQALLTGGFGGDYPTYMGAYQSGESQAIFGKKIMRGFKK